MEEQQRSSQNKKALYTLPSTDKTTREGETLK
jgi:hypothetical protein